MKKLILILMFVAGTAHADAGSAFVTGFANALNRSMGGNPNDSRPEPVQQVEIYQAPPPVIYPPVNLKVVAVREDGSQGGDFANYAGCRQFIHNTFGFSDCVVMYR